MIGCTVLNLWQNYCVTFSIPDGLNQIPKTSSKIQSSCAPNFHHYSRKTPSLSDSETKTQHLQQRDVRSGDRHGSSRHRRPINWKKKLKELEAMTLEATALYNRAMDMDPKNGNLRESRISAPSCDEVYQTVAEIHPRAMENVPSNECVPRSPQSVPPNVLEKQYDMPPCNKLTTKQLLNEDDMIDDALARWVDTDDVEFSKNTDLNVGDLSGTRLLSRSTYTPEKS